MSIYSVITLAKIKFFVKEPVRHFKKVTYAQEPQAHAVQVLCSSSLFPVCCHHRDRNYHLVYSNRNYSYQERNAIATNKDTLWDHRPSARFPRLIIYVLTLAVVLLCATSAATL